LNGWVTLFYTEGTFYLQISPQNASNRKQLKETFHFVWAALVSES